MGANDAGDVIQENAGPEHCSQEDMCFLGFEGKPYVRDPNRELSVGEGQIAVPFQEDAELPDGATFSGYRKESEELWHSPTVRAIFVGHVGQWERWPESFTGCV